MEQWVEDVGTAIEELKETAGVKRVALVGLRLGGAVAAMAAERRTDIEGVVLWDPVVDGKAYVVEMLEGRPRVAMSMARVAMSISTSLRSVCIGRTPPAVPWVLREAAALVSVFVMGRTVSGPNVAITLPCNILTIPMTTTSPAFL